MSCLCKLGVLTYFCSMKPVENLKAMTILPQENADFSHRVSRSVSAVSKAHCNASPGKNGAYQSDGWLFFDQRMVMQAVEEYHCLPNISCHSKCIFPLLFNSPPRSFYMLFSPYISASLLKSLNYNIDEYSVRLF